MQYMRFKNQLLSVFKSLLAICFILIGLINLFWGNDQFYGVFIILLALTFFSSFQKEIQKRTNISIPGWLLLLIAFFIIWSSLGVGELFDKIDRMINSFR